MRLNLKGFIAWIEVDGSVAQQYEEIISNDRLTIRCWIASEVGKKFRVCWKKPDSWKTVLVGGVNVDGIQCGGTICYKDNKKPISMSGFTTTNKSNRPFTFADLELTDDDTFLDVASDQLGEISLEIWRCKVQGKRDQDSSWAPPEDQKVHERSKKATTHKVQLGHEKTGNPSVLMQTKIIDKSPVVTFIFRYRPIDVLKALGAIPPTPMNSSGTESTAVDRNYAAGSKRGNSSRKKHARKIHVTKSEPSDIAVKREIEDGEIIDIKHERKRVKLEPLT